MSAALRVCSDDDALFTQLYRRHYRSIRDFCRRRVAHDLVDDVVAETFLTAWRRLDDLPAGKQTLVWLKNVSCAPGVVIRSGCNGSATGPRSPCNRSVRP